MGFPPAYVTWVILLYRSAESTVRNRGWFSVVILLGHGVRQGCPLSCHLFNLVSQVTIYYLSANEIFVWWILVGDPVSLYADDVAIVMRDLSQLKLIIELIQ